MFEIYYNEDLPGMRMHHAGEMEVPFRQMPIGQVVDYKMIFVKTITTVAVNYYCNHSLLQNSAYSISLDNNNKNSISEVSSILLCQDSQELKET
jgi:hypothetical protein